MSDNDSIETSEREAHAWRPSDGYTEQPPAAQQGEALYDDLTLDQVKERLAALCADDLRGLVVTLLIQARISERAFAATQPAAAPQPEPVYGDVLPPLGSRVWIRHGRDDDAHACTVVGYYAWPDLGGNRHLHRVFVHLVYAGTKRPQARMLCDVWPTEAEALAAAAPQPVAQGGELEKELADARDSAAFYRRRCDLLQQWQGRMRDPERTIVCDILANGQTLPDADGARYGSPAGVVGEPAYLAQPGGAAYPVETVARWNPANRERMTLALYIAPPARQALTDEQVDEEWFEVHHLPINNVAKARLFARAIERAHGIGGKGGE